MVLCVAVDRFPKITLTDEEQRFYDKLSSELLQRTLKLYHTEKRPDLNKQHWVHVRHRGHMDAYKCLDDSSNRRATLYLGKGLMRGTVSDIMDGLYCDTTPELRTTKTLMRYKFIDGGVFQVSQTRSPEAPYRFAGIKWFAAEMPALCTNRDMLNYEVMGQVMDEHGNEFAYHSYQSIDRPEWPADNIKGLKRAHTSTCYLYRTYSPDFVECFFQGDFFARGKIMQFVSDYGMAGKWLSVGTAVYAAQARKFSALMETASSSRRCFPSEICDVCHSRVKSRDGDNQCAGCMQNVCRDCSREQAIFQVSNRTGKPLKERFCIECVKQVTGSIVPRRKTTFGGDSMHHYVGSTPSNSHRGDSISSFVD